jgi:hypothetical protein
LDGFDHFFQFGNAAEAQIVESANEPVENLKTERGIQHATTFSPRIICEWW